MQEEEYTFVTLDGNESFEDAGFRETDVQGIDDDSSISAD